MLYQPPCLCICGPAGNFVQDFPVRYHNEVVLLGGPLLPSSAQLLQVLLRSKPTRNKLFCKVRVQRSARPTLAKLLRRLARVVPRAPAVDQVFIIDVETSFRCPLFFFLIDLKPWLALLVMFIILAHGQWKRHLYEFPGFRDFLTAWTIINQLGTKGAESSLPV